ncbi:MAG: hypothetical protein MUC49_18825 [Raineya sp.]|jgi:hypothetical protein|nr:hypothetical protein [Raineya sp.]
MIFLNDIKTKENLWTMLNSNDEQNIALATQILWNIEIPEEWIAFLFSKKDSTAIQELLNFKFPKEKFELAYQWFGLCLKNQQAKNLYLLYSITKLHKGFSWKYLLPLYIIPADYPYFIGGAAADINIDLNSLLFNYKYTPKKEIIALTINKNKVLDFTYNNIDAIPYDIIFFPELEGISTQNPIYHLPTSILKLSKLRFLNLGNVDYKDLKVAGLPFLETLLKYNPTSFVQLSIYKILHYSPYPYESLSTDKIDYLLKITHQFEVDKNLGYFLEALKLFFEKDYKKSYMQFKHLYENLHFDRNPIGSCLYNFISIFKLRFEFLEFFSDFFGKSYAYGINSYFDITFNMIINILERNGYSVGYSICRKCKNILIDDYHKQIFMFLEIVFAIRQQENDDVYNHFLERCEHYNFGGWISFHKEFISYNELLNYFKDHLTLLNRRKDESFTKLLAEFQHYALAIDNQ